MFFVKKQLILFFIEKKKKQQIKLLIFVFLFRLNKYNEFKKDNFRNKFQCYLPY